MLHTQHLTISRNSIGNTQSEKILKTSPLIAVDAREDWQSTGIIVKRGDLVNFTVKGGTWTGWREEMPIEIKELLPEKYRNSEIWINMWGENSGDGLGSKCADLLTEPEFCPVPSSPITSLVAKIGNTEPFEIGSYTTYTVANDGMIFLRINDGRKQGKKNLEDNAGVLAIEINVE